MKKTAAHAVIVLTALLSLDAFAADHAREKSSKANLVNIFMGTNNDGPSYSHGNQYPAVHTPFGMNAWSVGTTSLQESWFYDYKGQYITGVKLTHQPTVWGGDFGAIDFMPMTDVVQSDYTLRRSPYKRENEVARPYYYRNILDRYGITMEFVPSDRAAIFHFTYNNLAKPLLVINAAGANSSEFTQIDAHTIQGRVANGGIKSYFYAQFNCGIRHVSRNSQMIAAIEVDSNVTSKTVEMRVASSYISCEQARDNLAVELEGKSFETLKSESQDKWERALGRVEVAGGNPADHVTFYSALYRVFGFPKMHWEYIGRDARSSQYRSPFDGQVHANRKLWTGNGFWDTYRAVWPLFTILFPEMTGEMLDGWLNSYRDGGWTVRWSKPGYWDCMIGTHTDIIFADAFVKGIRNWDYERGYEASVKNAMVASAPGGRGRRYLERSAFLGYVPWTSTNAGDEVGARTMEDAVNDFGISLFAKALGKSADHAYFKNRAFGYVNLWSPTLRHFRGKNEFGAWRASDAEFNPYAWRYEWTEGNAWHYRAAPMHDGAGLAALFGGRQGLEQGLDEVMAASTKFDVGGYGQVIHEMLEARDAGNKGFGQFAIGNQPIQHLLHMYAFAGSPAKTQYWVRKALRLLFNNGVGTGYGYPGDEDNGQTSAWFVMNAMGFYSASPGHAEYVISSPLFESVKLHLENGRMFEITAKNNDERHVYIANATLNGKEYARPYLAHAAIMNGGLLAFVMSEESQRWADGVDAMPSSLTRLGDTPRYQEDLAKGATVTGSGENAPNETLAKLVDDNSHTKWSVSASQGTFYVTLREPQAANCYTMTSGNDAPARDPRAWQLYGSADGVQWQLLDQRTAVVWKDRLETKLFCFGSPALYKIYRVVISENAGGRELQLAEFELRNLDLGQTRSQRD